MLLAHGCARCSPAVPSMFCSDFVGSCQATLEKEKMTPVLHLVSEFSKGVIFLLYAGLLMMVLYWMLCGLPKKAPQHESVQDGCDTRSSVRFLLEDPLLRGGGVELQLGGTE